MKQNPPETQVNFKNLENGDLKCCSSCPRHNILIAYIDEIYNWHQMVEMLVFARISNNEFTCEFCPIESSY